MVVLAEGPSRRFGTKKAETVCRGRKLLGC